MKPTIEPQIVTGGTMNINSLVKLRSALFAVSIGTLVFTESSSQVMAQTTNPPASGTPAKIQQPMWVFKISGVGHVFFADETHDVDASSKLGRDDLIQVRRSFIDLVVEKKTEKVGTLGAKARLWLEPVFYNNDTLHGDGFGATDARLPLEFINELEVYLNQIPIDSKKVHVLSLSAGKGYVAFGFDRPEEQSSFSEFPMIHPITKATGLGQVMHTRLSYQNAALGLQLDGELYEPQTADTNLWDIDLPDSFGNSWALRARKKLPLEFESVFSFSNTTNTDGSSSDHFGVGIKKSQTFSPNVKLTTLLEFSSEDRTLKNGTTRLVDSWLAQAALLFKTSSLSVRYNWLSNPLRPANTSGVTANYLRRLYQSKDKKHKLEGFTEYSFNRGVVNPEQLKSTLNAQRLSLGVKITY